jgi:hypothetical protein
LGYLLETPEERMVILATNFNLATVEVARKMASPVKMPPNKACRPPAHLRQLGCVLGELRQSWDTAIRRVG